MLFQVVAAGFHRGCVPLLTRHPAPCGLFIFLIFAAFRPPLVDRLRLRPTHVCGKPQRLRFTADDDCIDLLRLEVGRNERLLGQFPPRRERFDAIAGERVSERINQIRCRNTGPTVILKFFDNPFAKLPRSIKALLFQMLGNQRDP